MSKTTTHRWGAYTRNQEAVAQAIARKEYTDMTPSGVGVVDEFFALMDQVGILRRLEVSGVYQRRLIPLVLLVVTYCAKVILGLSSQNQLATHLFRDAGLLRRIGYTAKQIDEGFSKRGKGQTRPIHKDTVADALERLTEEESARHFRWVSGGPGQSQTGGGYHFQHGWHGNGRHRKLSWAPVNS